MSEKFQPPTDFIEGLGIEFKHLPQPVGGEDHRRYRLGLHLKYMDGLERTTLIEKVHIPGTAIVGRRPWLGVADERPSRNEVPDGPRGMKVGIYKLEIKESRWQNKTFNGHQLFSAATAIKNSHLVWSPLQYTNHEGVVLEDPRDIDVAGAILEAAARRKIV